MGAVNSSVAGCFGNPSSLVKTETKPVIQHKDHDTRHNTESDLDHPDEPILKVETSPSDRSSPGHREQRGFGHCHLTLEDFDLIKTLGKGSFGKVYLVQKKTSKKVYALKALKKKDVMMKNLLKSTLTEKDILRDIEHPFVVQLKYSFQSASNMYMVTDFCPGGDLSHRLKRDGQFSEEAVKFYAAEIILALEYLHGKLNIIHRDIKPENILLAEDGHIKITDFGLSKTSPQAITLCGTPSYLAPEVIFGRTYGQEVDWWSLGCLIYEMLVGTPPFGCQRTDKIIESIMRQEPKIPDNFSDSLKDLLTRFLKKNPRERLGANGGAQEVKNHPYFNGIDWEALLSKKIIPPFQVPTIEHEVDRHQKEVSDVSILEQPQPQDAKPVDFMDFPEFSFAAEDAYSSLESRKTTTAK